MSAEPESHPAPLRAAGVTSGREDRSAAQAQVEELFVRCEARLGRYLAQFVRDRQLAEDLLQDTFHDALRAPGRLAEATSPEAWLFGIARHRALATLRRRRRFESAFRRLAAGRRATTEEDGDLVALRDLLERTLSPEDRSLVILRYLHEFEATELAEMTGLSADAVRQRLARARQRLLVAANEQEKGVWR